MPRMSRIKKSNRMKKEVLKSCLVAVLIGVIGTVGSFAYFKSKADVKTNLTVKTGGFKVQLLNNTSEQSNKLIYIRGLLPPQASSTVHRNSDKKSFKIKNNGSLNQKVEVYFSNLLTDIPKDELNGIKCEVTFKDKNDKVALGETKNCYLNELTSKKFIALDNQKRPITLKKDDIISCDFQITLTKAMNYKDSKKTIKFAVNAKAVQTNNADALK